MKKIFALALLLALLTPSAAAIGGGEAVKLPIVMYHHVMKSTGRLNDYTISEAQLECDLRYLRDCGYESVSLAQLLSFYEGKAPLPEKPVMITFDDGHLTSLAYAEPLLEKYGFTAIVAIIGSVTEEYSQNGDRTLDYAHLSWQDARAMAQRGIFEVQCHSWDMHRRGPRIGCGRLPGESLGAYTAALKADLGRFIAACDEHGVETCGGIAFPFGNYSDATVEIIRLLGFRAAFICQDRMNLLYGEPEELFRLARFNRPSGPSSEEFFKWA